MHIQALRAVDKNRAGQRRKGTQHLQAPIGTRSYLCSDIMNAHVHRAVLGTHPRTAATRRQKEPVARKSDGIDRRIVPFEDGQSSHRHRLPQSHLVCTSFHACLCAGWCLCVFMDGRSCLCGSRSFPRGRHFGTYRCANIRTDIETISMHGYR